MPKQCKLCGKYDEIFEHLSIHFSNLLSEDLDLQTLEEGFNDTEETFRVAAFQNPLFRKHLLNKLQPHTPFNVNSIILLAKKVEELAEGIYEDERRDAYKFAIAKTPEFKSIPKKTFITLVMITELFLDFKERYESDIELDISNFTVTPKEFLEVLVWTGATCGYPENWLFDNISSITALSEPIDQALSRYGFIESD